jgi:molybdopterin synthase catalytic subunit
MRSLKTAVKIWKKEIEFKMTTWGISPEHRTHYREMRREAYKGTKSRMIQDLLTRHRIGDITLERDHLEILQNGRKTPVFSVVEGIYKKYL